MSYSLPTDKSWFYWDSDLSDKRQEEIIAFAATLTEEQKKIVGDMIQDACRDAVYSESDRV